MIELTNIVLKKDMKNIKKYQNGGYDMYIIPLFIWATFKLIKNYEPIEKRIRKRDMNPYNSVKSNLWYK